MCVPAEECCCVCVHIDPVPTHRALGMYRTQMEEVQSRIAAASSLTKLTS